MQFLQRYVLAPCLTLSLVSGVPSFAKAPKNSDLDEIGNRNVNRGTGISFRSRRRLPLAGSFPSRSNVKSS